MKAKSHCASRRVGASQPAANRSRADPRNPKASDVDAQYAGNHSGPQKNPQAWRVGSQNTCAVGAQNGGAGR
jgi:hypothetical protein